MIDNLDNPAAVARVRWLSAADGGRISGPPTARVYASTCVFPLSDQEEATPEWLASTDMFSILLQRIDLQPAIDEKVKVGFLVPGLVAPYLRVNARVIITEGHKVVAHAVIQELCAEGQPDNA